MLHRIAAVLLLFAAWSGSSAEDPTVYELRFWPGKGVEKDPRYVSTVDHPCGKIVVARVRALPPVQLVSTLRPERVIEVGLSGRVIRRWPIPVDASPIALRGTSLRVESGTLKLWVTPQGAITPYKGVLSLPEPEPASCSPRREFGDSAYVQCRRFRDVSSGEYRILSFEGMCT
jgi:hypothetical protein